MTEATATYDDWQTARIGRITASRLYDVVGKTKAGQFTAKREDYFWELVAERMSGEPQENTFQSEDMLRGLDMEPRAVQAYEWVMEMPTQECGFFVHPTIEMAGASPDRLVGDNGILEVKCPRTKEHVRMIDGGAWKPEYLAQVDWQLASTGRQWCDLVSFDPRLLPHLQLYVERIHRDDERIQTWEAEVQDFDRLVDAKVDELNKRIMEMSRV